MQMHRGLRAAMFGVVFVLLNVVSVAGSAADERQRLANAFPIRFQHVGGGLRIDVVESAEGCRSDGTTTVTGTVKITHHNGMNLLLEGIASGETKCGGNAQAEDAGDDGAPRVILLVTPAPGKRSIVDGMRVQEPKIRLAPYSSHAFFVRREALSNAIEPEHAWVLRASGKVSTRSDAEDGAANEDVVFGEGVVSADVTYFRGGATDGGGEGEVYGAKNSRISANVRVRLGGAPEATTATTRATAGVILRAYVDYARPCVDAVKTRGVEAELSLASESGALTLPLGEATFFCGIEGTAGDKAFQVVARYERRNDNDDAMTLSLGGSGRQAVEAVDLSVVAHVGDTQSTTSGVKTLHMLDESAIANASAADLEEMKASDTPASESTKTPSQGDAAKDPEHGWLPFPNVAGLEISGTIVFVLAAPNEASPGLGLAWIAEAYFDRRSGDVDAPLELAYVDPPSNTREGDPHARGALIDFVSSGGLEAKLVSGDVGDGCKGGGASAQGIVRIDAPDIMYASFAAFGTRSCDRAAGGGNGGEIWKLAAKAVANITVLGGGAFVHV